MPRWLVTGLACCWGMILAACSALDHSIVDAGDDAALDAGITGCQEAGGPCQSSRECDEVRCWCDNGVVVTGRVCDGRCRTGKEACRACGGAVDAAVLTGVPCQL